MEEKRIKDLRMNLGLSQERFAQLLTVSLQTVRRWENGLARPLPAISLKLGDLEKKVGAARKNPAQSPVRSTVRRHGGMSMSSSTPWEATQELGLGGLFKGFGDLLDLLSRMAEEGKEEASHTGQVVSPKGTLRAVYGFNVRMGLGGKPLLEQFGNIRATERGAVVTETREPLVDLLDEGETLRVIAELPGIEEKDIQVRVEGTRVELTAESKGRKYYKEVLLPSAVEPESLASSCSNGVLELRLLKKPQVAH
ncbi:MAG: helix-turn-helix domain-containing protein [Chloroflexi bacterium]|nr:helix-turn-helix domain-containing protein [Chloroflexota bacterium]MBI4328749.1 helix-turn-helix domain-containing protein [Chloroflexota bacterium]